MNNESKLSRFFRNMFHVGTPECAIFFSVVAMVLAILLLSIGFWRTLLVAALALLGGVLGGVKDKKEWIRAKVNRLFPAREPVPYKEKNEEIQRVVREARQARESMERQEEKEEEEQEADDPGAPDPREMEDDPKQP